MVPPSATSTPTRATRTLSTAEERREAILTAAMPVFAEKGYHAAPTTEIAKGAGISQAYLFRLFPTKEQLFTAVIERSRERMIETFTEAADRAEAEGLDPTEQMGIAYADLVGSDRDVLLVQLHAHAISAYMPAAREAMRNCFAALYSLAEERTGGSPEELKAWFAEGMLINVLTAINAEQVDQPWARSLTDIEGDCFNQ
ncbi:MAG: TetR/AcrR family transcriptional regulator [Acidobacteriota bacterium]|jgi:AcrR family transcriptional regulator